jgi:hypothetical protein
LVIFGILILEIQKTSLFLDLPLALKQAGLFGQMIHLKKQMEETVFAGANDG